MKLALLGSDDEALALVRAALDSGRHELVWAGELADRRQVEQRLSEALAVERDDWEILAGGAADAVIVATSPAATGNDAARRADQLRQLVQAGVAVAVTNCGALGPIICYELDMNRVETQAPLVPYLADRRHPAIERVAGLIRAGTDIGAAPVSLGTVRQISIDRGTSDTHDATVVRALARDVDLVRAIAGDVTRVSAAGAPPHDTASDAANQRDFAGLNVYLTTSRGLTVRWAVDRRLPPGQGRITLDGDAGRAEVAMCGERWTLRIEPTKPTNVGRVERSEAHQESTPSAEGGTPNVFHEPHSTLPDPRSALSTREETFAPWRPAEAVLANLEAAVAGEAILPDWLDAARAADAADMVEVSLRRSRTIDLYNETYSEQGTFKGVMGIAGCGLLFVALFTLLGAAIGQKTARLLGWEGIAAAFGHWHYALLGVLVAFLLLQLLRFAALGSESNTNGKGPGVGGRGSGIGG